MHQSADWEAPSRMAQLQAGSWVSGRTEIKHPKRIYQAQFVADDMAAHLHRLTYGSVIDKM